MEELDDEEDFDEEDVWFCVFVIINFYENSFFNFKIIKKLVFFS